jgi:hypothetical protein
MGGIVYLVAVLTLGKWAAIAVTGTITLLIVILRLGFRQILRGVRGDHPAQNWAEISYPAVCTISLIVGWGILGDRWLAFLPIAFVSWGDNAAGLAQMSPNNAQLFGVWRRCLWFVCVHYSLPSYCSRDWGNIVTLAERFRRFLKVWDDNLNILATCLPIMVALQIFLVL